MAITQLNSYLPGQNLTNLAGNVDYNRVGDDKTDITINHGTSPWTFTIKVGSLIEKDGNLYTVDTADYTLQATDNTHNYIVFTGSAFASSSSRGTYDPAKGGFYDGSGNRVLKYYIDPDEDSEFIIQENESRTESSIISNYEQIVYLTSAGTTSWTAPFSKYYTIEIVGKGGDGGAAGVSSSFAGGGGSAVYGRKKIFITKGDTWTGTFGTTSGGNTSVSDGTTTLTVQNGFTGVTAASNSRSFGGAPGTTSSGLDFVSPGGYGGTGTRDASTADNPGFGAASYFGAGGAWQSLSSPNGVAYGSGGCGATNASAAGTGGPAVIIITG